MKRPAILLPLNSSPYGPVFAPHRSGESLTSRTPATIGPSASFVLVRVPLPLTVKYFLHLTGEPVVHLVDIQGGGDNQGDLLDHRHPFRQDTAVANCARAERYRSFATGEGRLSCSEKVPAARGTDTFSAHCHTSLPQGCRSDGKGSEGRAEASALSRQAPVVHRRPPDRSIENRTDHGIWVFELPLPAPRFTDQPNGKLDLLSHRPGQKPGWPSETRPHRSAECAGSGDHEADATENHYIPRTLPFQPSRCRKIFCRNHAVGCQQ